MPEAAFDTLPCARDIFRDLDSVDKQPVIYLIRGRSQTGKSTLLAEIRARLRARGVTVQDDTAVMRRLHNGAHPALQAASTTAVGGSSVATSTAKPALVIDNTHLLSPFDLEYLCAAITTETRTVILAMQPRPHDPRLRRLTDAINRRGRIIDLRPLGVADMAPFARELGLMVPRRIAQHIHAQTAGIRGGVVTALSAACSARLNAGVTAVDTAVTTWARGLLDDLEPDLMATLVVATTGTGLDSGELSEVLGVEPTTAQELIDRARASALVTDADLLLAPAVAPLRTLLGERKFVAIERKLLSTRLEAGLLRDHTALQLAESGVRDPRLAGFLITAAEKAGCDAGGYYAAAAAAGAELDPIALRWAEAAARTGDGDTAMRLAEPMLARPGSTGAELATAVRICATVLTRRGLVGRAAQLYTWLGANRAGPDWAIGAIVLYLAGDPAGAEQMSASAAQWPPTEANARAGLIATTLADTIGSGASAATALPALRQAAHPEADADLFLPCLAVTIATVIALSGSEPQHAAEVLCRASASGLNHPHLEVLTAWTAMLRGDERTAADTIATLNHDELDVRARLLAHGIAVGLARRSGDHIALARAWQTAYPMFDGVQADLLALLPIGELWLAGIRMRDERRIAPLVDAGLALLRRMSEPPIWSNTFHWYGVQAAIAHRSPEELLPHARALQTAAETGDRHATVLADASRTWMLVLRGQTETAPVGATVTGLAGIGMSWDGARLATEAAHAVPGTPMADELLELARTIRADARPQDPRPQPAGAAAHTDDETAPAPATKPAPAILSEREHEVAELVLLGLTYREIGARLYISAKTVEHHVARIRRRVGARSRSELLSMLRAMGHNSLLV
ncbi:LuxR C-terminal-related transcriptional regulator [Nocardia sp. 004]|uniref:LuxR C-terminal-related transcriptional regulator n=1 Tax=Nocardia sp. 004 TaxID=3385978 RepID=UPI00399EEBF8